MITPILKNEKPKNNHSKHDMNNFISILQIVIGELITAMRQQLEVSKIVTNNNLKECVNKSNKCRMVYLVQNNIKHVAEYLFVNFYSNYE